MINTKVVKRCCLIRLDVNYLIVLEENIGSLLMANESGTSLLIKIS